MKKLNISVEVWGHIYDCTVIINNGEYITASAKRVGEVGLGSPSHQFICEKLDLEYKTTKTERERSAKYVNTLINEGC